jgi:hypothetical protein
MLILSTTTKTARFTPGGFYIAFYYLYGTVLSPEMILGCFAMSWEVQMKRQIFTLIALALSFSALPAKASLIDAYSDMLTAETFWADSIVFRGNFDQAPGRDNPANAFGPPDGDFYSIGLGEDGGFIGFGFGGRTFTSGGIATIWEVTFPPVASWPEAVDITVGLASTGTFFEVVGPVLNSQAQTGFEFLIPETGFIFDTILPFDVTSEVCGHSPSCFGDGWDISGLSFLPFKEQVSQVPVPGSLALMGLGLLGLGLSQRREMS